MHVRFLQFFLLFLIGKLLWWIFTGFADGRFATIVFCLTFLALKRSSIFNNLFAPKPTNWWRVACYLPHLLWMIIAATWQTLIIVWNPLRRPAPGLLTVAHSPLAAHEQMLYAHSITLTPGTFTVASDTEHLLIHALDVPSNQSIQAGDLERLITKQRGN